MNPCGFAVDWGRRPYTTNCQIFTGEGVPVSRLRWYVTGKPFQKFPSAINSLDWEEDKTYKRILGEQPGDRTYNGRWRQPDLPTEHQCGEPGLFLHGAPFDPTKHYPMDDDNIPLCCLPGWIFTIAAGANAYSSLSANRLLAGYGANAGAHAYSFFTAIPATAGLGSAGALAAGHLAVVRPLSGEADAGALAAGLLGIIWPMESQLTAGADAVSVTERFQTITGEALAGAHAESYFPAVYSITGTAYSGAHAFSFFSSADLLSGEADAGTLAAGALTLVSPPPPPPPPTPGTSCATAGTMTLGVPVDVTVPSGFTILWLKFAIVSGTTYHVTASAFTNISSVVVDTGPDCSSLTHQFSLFGNGCNSFVAPSSGWCFVQFSPGFFGDGSVTVVGDTGGC